MSFHVSFVRRKDFKGKAKPTDKVRFGQTFTTEEEWRIFVIGYNKCAEGYMPIIKAIVYSWDDWIECCLAAEPIGIYDVSPDAPPSSAIGANLR
jgi:hypothetical protein